MILVAEGPSAAGKTTWVARWPARHVVPETGRVQLPGASEREEVTRLLVDLNCAKWALAIAAEHAAGIAICDGDPLKLHYDYSLARVGKGSWDQFWASVQASRSAISQKRLGIADLIVCHVPDETTLDRHQRSDPSRARRNFDTHRTLGPALADWYRTLERIDPNRVAWGFPAHLPNRALRPRFDLTLFDEWMRSLPALSNPTRREQPRDATNSDTEPSG